MALAVIGLFATDWADKFPALTRLGSKLPTILHSLPGVGGLNPNELAGGLMWVLPMQLAVLGWWAHRPAKRVVSAGGRLLMLFAVAVTMGTLVLTQSRGGFLGFSLGLALLLWLVFPRARLLFATLLLAGVAVTVLIGPERISDNLSQAVGHGVRIDSILSSLGGREAIWTRALEGIEDFPVTGMGMDSFRWLLPIVYPVQRFSPDANLPHAHDHLLQVALDLGLPGLVGYLAIWMLAIALVVMTFRGSPDRRDRAVVAGMAAGLLAYFVYGITDAVPLGAKPGLFFWALLALLVAIHQRQHRAMAAESTQALSTQQANSREPVLV
jgi:O-antigen ligase